jgi:splicing factor U2AF subunit
MLNYNLVVANVSDEEMQEHYDNFFEDVFVELEDKYGEIEEMNVCDNLGDHLVGNVYIKVSFIDILQDPVANIQ